MAAPGVTNRKRLLILLLGFTLTFFGLYGAVGLYSAGMGKRAPSQGS